MKRVQNLALWQSYAALRKTRLLRAKAEGSLSSLRSFDNASTQQG